MNNQPLGNPYDENAASQPPQNTPRRGFRPRLWMFVLPLIVWMACLGLAAVILVGPLLSAPRRTRVPIPVPVTGGEPTARPSAKTVPSSPASPSSPAKPSSPTTPPSAKNKPVPGDVFLSEAKSRLDTCSTSFHDYFILEQIAANRPGVFQDDSWRSDVTQAMQSFRDDCQPLGTMPTAPPAYAEIDHWLKLAAAEVGPATDSLTAAISHDQVDQFQASIDHLSKFVDYIHNAEGAMDGVQQRKEI